jgi:alpha-tubulin suppressor-like RCC1 family protein
MKAKRGGGRQLIALAAALVILTSCQAGPDRSAPGTTSPTNPRPTITREPVTPTAAATASPAPITADTATAISVGLTHACALMSGGKVKCWGANQWGQLGNVAHPDGSLLPVDVGLPEAAIAIAAGEYHTCAIVSHGNVMCWGYGNDGQIGSETKAALGTIASQFSPVPIDVPGLSAPAVAISAGDGQTCVLTAAGDVTCWGDFPGNGLDNSATPVKLSDIPSGIKAIASGASANCLVVSGGGIKCWGSNNAFGQLGNGSHDENGSTGHYTPLDVVGFGKGRESAQAVTVGRSFACALTDPGAVSCWGNDIYGQLGNGLFDKPFDPSPFPVPVEVSGLKGGIRAISAGLTSVCAITDAGGLKCWGSATGNVTPPTSSLPVDVVGLDQGVVAVSVGGPTCVLMSNGGVKCWSTGSQGVLGNGTNNESATPVDVILSAAPG